MCEIFLHSLRCPTCKRLEHIIKRLVLLVEVPICIHKGIIRVLERPLYFMTLLFWSRVALLLFRVIHRANL